MNEIILYLILKYRGNWMRIFNSLEKKELFSIAETKNVYDKISTKFISIVDKDYPYFLKETYKPPFGLFYHGKFNLLSGRLFTIIGNFEDSNVELLKFLIDEGYNIIVEYNQTNLKYFASLETSGIIEHLIFASPSGLQQVTIEDGDFVSSIKNAQLIVSEIPDNNINDDPDQSFYRLLVGLSKKVLIIDSENLKDYEKLLFYCLNENAGVYKQIVEYNESEIIEWNKYNVNLFRTSTQLKQIITYKS